MKFMTHSKKGHKLTRFGLLSAYAGLLVLFACPLAASTLAWFSIGSYTRVRDITFSFQGASLSSKLRLAGSANWMLPDADNAFRFSDEFSFTPVSGMFADAWYSPSMDPEKENSVLYRGYSDFDSYVGMTSPASANSDYISLEFVFAATSDTYLFLDSSTSLSADSEANLSSAKGDLDYAAKLDNIENACRVSFFSNMGYTIYEPNVSEGSSTYFGGRLNVRPSEGYWDYDSEGKEILFGEVDPKAYDELEYEVAGPSTIRDPFSTLQAVSKEGILAIKEESLDKVKEEGLIAKETSYTLSELDAHASKKHPVLFIPAQSSRRLLVNLYLEGWDLDCDDDLIAATLAAKISFTGVYVPKGTSGYPLPVLGKDARSND